MPKFWILRRDFGVVNEVKLLSVMQVHKRAWEVTRLDRWAVEVSSGHTECVPPAVCPARLWESITPLLARVATRGMPSRDQSMDHEVKALLFQFSLMLWALSYRDGICLLLDREGQPPLYPNRKKLVEDICQAF